MVQDEDAGGLDARQRGHTLLQIGEIRDQFLHRAIRIATQVEAGIDFDHVVGIETGSHR